MRRKILIVFAFLFPITAFAPPPEPVCELTGRTVGDMLAHPPMGGDFRTIYSKAAIPNIAWVLDTSGSMRALPCEGNCDIEDCNLEAEPDKFLRMGYDPAQVYDPIFPECNANDDPKPCFDPTKVYKRSGSGCSLQWVETTLPTSGQQGYRCQTDGLCYTEDECLENCSTPCPQGCSHWFANFYQCNCDGNIYWGKKVCESNCRESHCQPDPSCGDPYTQHLQQYGWVEINGDYYFSGNLLNFYPPKYIAARKAFYELLNFPEVRRIRMNIYGHDYSYGAEQLGNLGACLNPSCNMLNNDSAFDNNRNAIQNFLRNHGISLFSNNTPLAEVVFNLGQLYATNTNWSTFGLTVKDENDFRVRNCTGNKDPVCEDVPCVKNFIVYITDGLPWHDCNNYISTSTSNDYWGDRPVMDHDPVQDTWTVYGNQDGYNVSSERSRQTCLDDITHFLYSHDFRPDRDGIQNVSSYFIGFGLPSGEDPGILISAARNGGGLFLQADDYNGLVKAIKDALLDILSKTSAFTTAVVPKLRTESTGGVIVGRFKPSKMPIWEGHLYRFDIFSEEMAGTDLNNDGDMEDTLLVDKDGDIIEEDEEGNYVKQGTSDPAVPYWDGGEVLKNKPLDSRRIYTAVDVNGDGRIDRSDGLIEFNTANASVLADWLLPDYPANCSDIALYAGDPSVYDKQNCASAIINYIRGWDIFDYDSDGIRNEPRAWILGDIMHSNPIEVYPPVFQRLCKAYGAFKMFPQCLRALFDTKPEGMLPLLESYQSELSLLPDDLQQAVSLHAGGDYNAYTKFVVENFDRDKLILVGANDGMLHAFHGGTLLNCDYQTMFCEYDQGTGEELWAFIPPDLLPKLRYALFDHQLFVDATPMVRDVWFDENGDYVKQWNEFHTITVIGERGGGVHFSALDITDVNNPEFLWIFPQPDDPAGNIMGQTWSDHLPHSPPIGPVKIKDTSIPAGWRETWAVALNGGYDDADLRGRGVFIVNAYTGEKIWEYTYDPTASDARAYMKYSFPGTLAFLSHSWYFGEPQNKSIHIPIFDLLVAGDAGGQIWTFNLRKPGPEDWFGYRVFEESKDSIYLADRNPFFVMPAATPLIPYSWAIMMGTGDRRAMYECEGGECSTYNVRPCKKKGCTGGVYVTTNVRTSDDFSASQTVDSSSQVTAESYTFSENTRNACDIDFYIKEDICGTTGAKESSYQCSSAGGSYSCTLSTHETGTLDITQSLTLKAPSFYSIRVPKEWVEDGTSHDLSRFTDTDLADATQGFTPTNPFEEGWKFEMPDEVVATSADVPLAEYQDVLKEGCITWSTFEPDCGAAADPCSTTGGGTAYLYQANFFTGSEESLCGDQFESQGATARRVVIGSSPPLPPTQSPTYSGGQLQFYTIITAPGTNTSLVSLSFGATAGGGNIVMVQEVSRRLHEEMCRYSSDINTPGLASHPPGVCQ